MVTPSLGNCPECGQLFLKIRPICDGCVKKQEDDYKKVADYLRKRPGSVIQAVSDETGVPTLVIRRFIQSGRIQAGHFPNLSYPCDACGTSICSGNLCETCSESFLERYDVKEERQDGRNKTEKAGYIFKYL